ncbi:HK [Lepeophtheirus salmonis]|uniref:HK n=1 Tax=Lepeophtheirus salmonis TaxID=72036 RepID=A0A7R8CJS4_LEPSM|nr:HK [Lepeophtheirus salmonis]CAF2841151.1 HK [Lepeophtheirus salmonis]
MCSYAIYKPKSLGDKICQFKDHVRDLIINNYHISEMARRMRSTIKIESDQFGDRTLCRKSLQDSGNEDASDKDCSSIRYVCEKVSWLRGFIYRFHPHFPNIMRSRIYQLMGIDYKFDFMLSTDGSGRALVTANLFETICKLI